MLQWLGLIGDMFIRSLRCVVLPLAFINVIISVVDMMTVGRAGTVGGRTILLYLATTVVASLFGIISVLIFKGLYDTEEFEPESPAVVSLGCNAPGAMVTESPDGTLVCKEAADDASMQDFTITDLSGSFVAQSGGTKDDISLSDTFYQGVFEKLISNNIVGSFVEANFAAVIVFAIAVGVALSKVLDKKSKGERSTVMGLLAEMDGLLQVMIRWIIAVTPFAVFSLISQAVGRQSDLGDQIKNVGFLIVTTIVAVVMHVLTIHYLVFWLVTKRSPWSYLRHIVPAQTMAFACASSAATIPVTFRSVEATGRVPKAVARFIIPLGATINMDGGAIYFPVACVWLAILNGIQPNVGHYVLLVIISTIGSAGAAPVPSASLVLIITAYNTVFNSTGTPDGFSFILAIDWFMDRIRTVTNVTGDAVVSGIISEFLSDEDRQMMEERYEEELGHAGGPTDSARDVLVEVRSN